MRSDCCQEQLQWLEESSVGAIGGVGGEFCRI